MLHVKPIIDDRAEKFLSSEGVTAAYTPGVDVALFDDGKMIGAAHVAFATDAAVLEGVYVTPARRGVGLGDFLTRATMDAYTKHLPLFKVAYKSDYFLKFGFEEENDGMTIQSEGITFPSQCGGHK